MPDETTTMSETVADDGDNFDASGDEFDIGTLNEAGAAPTPPPAAEPSSPPPTGAAPPAPPTAPTAPTEPTTPAAAPAQPTTPAAPAAPAAPTVPTVPVAAPATPPTAPAAPATPAAPTAPAASAAPPAQTPEQAIEARTKWRNDTIDALARGHYNLSPELVEEIQTTPEVTIPKLMARVYLDAAEAAALGVMQNLPNLITSQMQRMEDARSAETEFYTAWPVLERDKHHDAVLQLATAYRQLNPNATKDDFIKIVGSQAIVALGLTQAVAPAAPAATPAASATPGAPPFRPLASSAPATRPLSPPQVSPFAQFAEEDLAYDKGE